MLMVELLQLVAESSQVGLMSVHRPAVTLMRLDMLMTGSLQVIDLLSG